MRQKFFLVQMGIKTMLCEMIIANKVEYVCFTYNKKTPYGKFTADVIAFAVRFLKD